MPQVAKVVVSASRRGDGPSRPRILTVSAVLFILLGIVIIALAAAAPLEEGQTFQPFFHVKMQPMTRRFYSAILGIGSVYLGYAFLKMHRVGLFIFLTAAAVQTANYLCYFNWARGVALTVDVLFVAIVLWAWLPLLKKR